MLPVCPYPASQVDAHGFFITRRLIRPPGAIATDREHSPAFLRVLFSAKPLRHSSRSARVDAQGVGLEPSGTMLGPAVDGAALMAISVSRVSQPTELIGVSLRSDIVFSRPPWPQLLPTLERSPNRGGSAGGAER